ncbi:alpha/beta hydrolase [Paenibacillaceae bacterium]|nr:alpha/beta hydrolase [Paenibacillaceae bacterium]
MRLFEEAFAVTIQCGQYILVEPGVELFVQDVGEGEPIVFIPGWTFTTEVFAKQVEHFKQTNRVIVIDPRSHGRSSTALHGNNYVTQGSDLAKVLDALKLESFTLAGWSFGALTAWEYIRQHGTQRIKAFLWIDISPKPLSTTHETDWVEGPLDDIAGAYNLYTRDSAGQRDFVTYYVKEVMFQREVEESELSWLIEQSLHTPHYIAANLFAAGMFSDYREEARLVSESVPTLVIAAEHWAETATAYVGRIAPQASIEVLGGHLMFWEHADSFNRIVATFLQSAAQTVNR